MPRRVALARLGVPLVLALAVGLVPASGSAGAAADCVPTTRAGDQNLKVSSAGRTYSVLVHVPAEAADSPALVVNLHGATQSGAAHRDSTGMNASADRHGYVVAYPTGGILHLPLTFSLYFGYFWNVPGVPMVADLPVPPGSRDDARFVLDVVAAVQRAACTDPRRVYATGASNGGIFSSYLACHHADVFAAVAPVMGIRAGRGQPADPQQIDTADCTPSRPVPLLGIHGRKDPLLPYEGNRSKFWGYGVDPAAERWAVLNDCSAGPVASHPSSTITRRVWSSCAGGVAVELLDSTTGGHSWWGHPTPFPFNLAAGPDELSADANELIWSFLSRYTLPG